MDKIDKVKENIRNKSFDKQEKILLYNVIDKIKESYEKNEIIVTNFYNLNELSLIKENILKFINNAEIYGGYDNFDRNVLIIFPSKEKNNDEYITKNIGNSICCIKVIYDKYVTSKISHRDILGTILSLGINRNLIGNIYINDKYAHVVVKNEISDYIIKNIDKVKNTRVKLEKIDISKKIDIIDDGIEDTILVNSFRLDNVLSVYLKTSRSIACEYINQGKVFINWSEQNKIDKLVKIADVISIKGKGRIVIKEIKGITKKGKNILDIIKYE